MSDSLEIQPDDRLLRWLHPGQFDWEENRATSAAFKDPQMSVDILSMTTVDESYQRAQKQGKNAVVSFTYQQVKDLELEVKHDPVDGNNAHALVLGNKTKSIAKKLAQACKVEIYPPENNQEV
jgi:tRNA(Leu) C34 or U34 (ribose-2'-O)-methylase TrmL